jgi:hypothetical protein
MSEVHAFGLHKHPMDSGDFDAVPFGGFANFVALFLGNIGDELIDRKRRDFDGVIASLCRKRHRLLQLPVLENLIANAEFHRSHFTAKPRRTKAQSRGPARRVFL